jgi:cyanate permease
MPKPPHNTPAHRAIAIAGWTFVVIGLVGVILWPGLAVVWAFLIAFGIAALPRALVEYWKRRRKPR